jgi:predicted nucleic acid-binding protein
VEGKALPHGLIDTDILIDASREFQQAREFLHQMRCGEGVSFSAISAMELIAGCRDRDDLDKVNQFLARSTVVPFSPRISARAQLLMQTYTLSHGLQSPDALIAATALESGLPLYTRNVRHFQMIPGLQIIRPY